MKIGIVELHSGLHGLLRDALLLSNFASIGIDEQTALQEVALIIIHPNSNRSQDDQIRDWHEQHIPIVMLSCFESKDYFLAQEIDAPIFYIPFAIRDVVEAVAGITYCARYAPGHPSTPAQTRRYA